MSHFKKVCQYGYVHSQCRCPDPAKQVQPISCDRLFEHASRPDLDFLVKDTSSLLELTPELLHTDGNVSELKLDYIDHQNKRIRFRTT